MAKLRPPGTVSDIGDLRPTGRRWPSPGASAASTTLRLRGVSGAADGLRRAASESPDKEEHRAAHERILGLLTTPGRVDEVGNELPANLHGLGVPGRSVGYFASPRVALEADETLAALPFLLSKPR